MSTLSYRLGGEASAARRLYYCMRNQILHSVKLFVRTLYKIRFFSRLARGLLHW